MMIAVVAAPDSTTFGACCAGDVVRIDGKLFLVTTGLLSDPGERFYRGVNLATGETVQFKSKTPVRHVRGEFVEKL